MVFVFDVMHIHIYIFVPWPLVEFLWQCWWVKRLHALSFANIQWKSVLLFKETLKSGNTTDWRVSYHCEARKLYNLVKCDGASHKIIRVANVVTAK